ncbi:MAG TPA: hypothetical protein VHO25_20055 [Polyangiaceae bacterium]|nr:hypothetical protein [Polyangiaceae bacterium]
MDATWLRSLATSSKQMAVIAVTAFALALIPLACSNDNATATSSGQDGAIDTAAHDAALDATANTPSNPDAASGSMVDPHGNRDAASDATVDPHGNRDAALDATSDAAVDAGPDAPMACLTSNDCNSPNSCESGAGTCTNHVCVYARKAAGTICRDQAGDCDRAETCDGTSSSCPVDTFESATTECRASGGPCDIVELCDGVSADCPSDQNEPNGTVCNAKSNAACDVDDVCTGGKTCPVKIAGANTSCRDAANACDAEELCDGTSESCPTDLFQSDTTGCGAVAYTGLTPNATNCAGANSCGPGFILVCGDSHTCNGTAATCTNCSCYCDLL